MDLMGGRSQDTDVTATALPSRGKYWIVFIGNWTPKVSGPAGEWFDFYLLTCVFAKSEATAV